MIQKPEIQYIGQFYVYGSEAREAELKAKKAKAHLPKPKLEKAHKVYIDPVALGGILVAVVILAVMALGAVRLNESWQQYNRMESYLSELRRENTNYEHAYRTALNLEQIQTTAEAMGMIPASEAKTMKVRVTIPVPEQAPGAWDNFLWFIRGLVD